MVFSNNKETDQGGGVHVYFGGPIFVMHGGTISGNNSGSWGGGIANEGVFLIGDGIIYGVNAASALQNSGAPGAALFTNHAGGAQSMYGAMNENSVFITSPGSTFADIAINTTIEVVNGILK